MAGAFPQQEFGQLKGQARLAKIADAKRTDYWGGSTWVYNSTILNAALGAQTVTVIPGEDNEMELLYGSMFNLTGGNITGTVRIRDPDGNQLLILYRGVSNSSNALGWPTNSNSTTNALPAAGSRFLISGEMKLELEMGAVPDTKSVEYSVVGRVRGEAPTVVEDGAGVFVPTVRTNRFF